MNVLLRERTWCDRCGRRELSCRLTPVLTAKQTHWSPAEYDQVCRHCVSGMWAEDDPHERAAARARANDFAETNFRDWS